MLKKIFSISLVMCLLFLCSCGKTDKTGGGNKDTDKASDDKLDVVISGHEDWTEGMTMNDIPDDQKDVTILMSAGWDYWNLMHSDEQPDAHVAAKMAWEETIGGTVTIKVVTETMMTSYLATAVASDTAPDSIPGNFFPNWTITGFTADLSDEKLAKHLDWDNDKLWDKNTSKNWIWNGEWTGLRPYVNNDPWVIAYNKTKFEAAGEKTPMDYYKEGKWTWTQFVQTAKNMTDIVNDEYGYIGLYIQPSLAYKLDASGHFYVDSGNNIMRKNTEIYNFFQSNGNPARCSSKNLDFRNLFAGGTDAMTVLGLNEYERLVTTAKQNGGDEFGMAPMFSWDIIGEKDPYIKNSTWAYTICSASNRKVGVAEYIHLEAMFQMKQDEIKEKTKKALYTKDELKAIEDLDKVIANLKIDPADREYFLSVSGGPDMGSVMFSKQTLSMKAIVDKGMPVLNSEIDKINNTVDLYKGK